MALEHGEYQYSEMGRTGKKRLTLYGKKMSLLWSQEPQSMQ
jgi:hypothetical protein